ncbi:hypothetical protein E1269_28180, partial [Jiangella asiatica]
MKSAATLTVAALVVVIAGAIGVGALVAAPSVGDDFGDPVDVGTPGSSTSDPGTIPSETPSRTPSPTRTPTP